MVIVWGTRRVLMAWGHGGRRTLGGLGSSRREVLGVWLHHGALGSNRRVLVAPLVAPTLPI